MNKEEIKEILELYKNEDIEYYNLVSDLGYDKLLDYITNLQERFNALLEAHKIADELETEYQNRINKALDYIKIEFCQINEETKELECWHKRVEPILDILNGKEYKEEE